LIRDDGVFKEGDWLFQSVRPGTRQKKTTSIEMHEVFGLASNNQFREDSDVWYWDGSNLDRIYRRSHSSEVNSTEWRERKKVVGMMVPDNRNECIIIHIDADTFCCYDKTEMRWLTDEVEEAQDVTVDLNTTVPGVPKHLLTDDEALLVRIAKNIQEHLPRLSKCFN